MIFKSTKTFYNLPCSHQQWRDADESGESGSGQCAKTHGYSRSFHLEFSCTHLDDYGWVVGFGSLKAVKKYLEGMFDHTSLWEASDPRLEQVKQANAAVPFPFYEMRILPTGVSMEQTGLFLIQRLNRYILEVTEGRCWVSKLEVRENDKNSGIIEVSHLEARAMKRLLEQSDEGMLEIVKEYPYTSPAEEISQINSTVQQICVETNTLTPFYSQSATPVPGVDGPVGPIGMPGYYATDITLTKDNPLG